jgi:outer membrane protein
MPFAPFAVALAVTRVLTLADALSTARAAHPTLRQARAQTRVAEANAGVVRAGLLPSLSGTALYQRTTANFVFRPGTVPRAFSSTTAGLVCLDMPQPAPGQPCMVAGISNTATTSGDRSPTLDSFNFWNFGLTTNQPLYDSNVTIDRLRAARVLAESQEATARATEVTVLRDVRVAFFAARAQKALVEVAREALTNQERHLRQIEGFVRIGTRPDIDLAQARTDRANAVVQRIQAENVYEQAKAQLNLAMGREGPLDYDVTDETLPPIEREDAGAEAFLDEVLRGRPDVEALQKRIRAQELTISAAKGTYGPALGFSAGATYAGTDLSNLAWNLSASLTLNWNIFTGLSTWEQVKLEKANLESLVAQRDLLVQQIRLQLVQALLQVHGAKAALGAADEALTAARERLRLAEGRYAAGVGSVIELGDAQLALTQAAAQRVRAEYDLATARAQLLAALGRP